MRRAMLVWLLAIVCASALGAPAERAIVVTVDGLRWQEVFRGADAGLLGDERFTPKDSAAFPAHQSVGSDKARQQLMPFFWGVIAQQGSVVGNRDQNSFMRVTNPWWFSYPGYNEILTGRADPAIASNDKRWNENVTVLEWLNAQPGFRGKIQAFGSWDVFPYIINSQRSHVPVNVATDPVVGKPTAREVWLQRLQQQMPLAFPAVRHDAFTHNYALEAMRTDQPRVLYVAYGEPDDFAHAGKYSEYLAATRRFDDYLRELWDAAQSDRAYRNRTVLLITTDHGRGEAPVETWQHHASAESVRGPQKYLAQYPNGIVGSDQIWFAALGPGVAARGVVPTDGERTQAQIAATLIEALGLSADQFDERAAPALREIFDRAR